MERPSAPPLDDSTWWLNYGSTNQDTITHHAHCPTCCCGEAPPPYPGDQQGAPSCSHIKHQRLPNGTFSHQMDHRSSDCSSCKNMDNSASHEKRLKRIKTGLKVAAGVFFPVTLLYLVTRTHDRYDNENNRDLDALADTTEKVLTKIKVLKSYWMNEHLTIFAKFVRELREYCSMSMWISKLIL